MTTDSSRAALTAPAVTANPLYGQALRCMQQGQWAKAADGLAALEQRYPGCAELRRLRETLALRRSAEESWCEEERRIAASPWRSARRLASSYLNVPAVRILSIANLFVYLGFGLLSLLAR